MACLHVAMRHWQGARGDDPTPCPESTPMLPEFQFGPPPAGGKPYLRLVIPRVGAAERFVSYSRAVVGLYTHWADGRTQPHFSPAERCIWCEGGVPLRWKGYLLGWSLNSRGRGLLELPACSCRRTPALLDPAVDLAGALVTATRLGPERNSEVRVQLQLHAQTVQESCPPTAVLDALCRIWGVQAPGAAPPPAPSDLEGGGP